jgi:hypothetical protein
MKAYCLKSHEKMVGCSIDAKSKSKRIIVISTMRGVCIGIENTKIYRAGVNMKTHTTFLLQRASEDVLNSDYPLQQIHNIFLLPPFLHFSLRPQQPDMHVKRWHNLLCSHVHLHKGP